MNFSIVTTVEEVVVDATTSSANFSMPTDYHVNKKFLHDLGNISLAISKLFFSITAKAANSTKYVEEVEEINHFYFYETEQFTVLWILFAIIVLGNTAVLVTLFINRNRKSRMNFFIKHLAIADLSVGLLNVLTDIIWRITVTWEAGNLACKFIKFTQCLVTYASTYVLVALSIDRYDAITHPMNFSSSWKRAKLLVISAWIMSALFSTPQFFLYEETLIQGRTQCWIELGESWRWQLYMTLVSIVLFIIPALIISLCYAIIVKTIWEKGTYMGTKDRTKKNGKSSSTDDDDRGSRRASSRGIIPRAKVKTVKMTFVIVIVFIACWSPYIVFDLLQVFDQIPKTQTNIAIATFIQSLAPLNSAANPLIYCLFSTQVWKTLRRTAPFLWLTKVCCCKKKELPKSQFINGRIRGGPRNLHQNYDSMRTFTTSLTVTSRHSTCTRPNRVVILENQKTFLPTQEENER
ncbi:cardioacceleratory peptide receptor-like isoform X1 [Chironomus tepperi]|uniref:cardioacceleratory peptide receptor-like isoform X1 n=1 Tax=Chironomus tepperi TaxID=113505 RepID=UPI00391F9B10